MIQGKRRCASTPWHVEASQGKFIVKDAKRLSNDHVHWKAQPLLRDRYQSETEAMVVTEQRVSETTRHDAWQAGDSYDAYMGRWSRQLAPRFLDWLNTPDDLDWLEVGCGTGALSAAIFNLCRPKSLSSIDSSEDFLAKAKQNVPIERIEFQIGDAQALHFQSKSWDIAVSGLVLNFVPERKTALVEMKRVIRPGGTVAFYVWDYPGEGVEFMRAFWNAAVALDPSIEDLKEDRRFPYCTREDLTDLAKAVGLANVDCTSIEIPTVFKDFDDFWHPFTLGAGPAPGYCTSLKPEDRKRLKDKLQSTLSFDEHGSILLKARAWAVRGNSAAM